MRAIQFEGALTSFQIELEQLLVTTNRVDLPRKRLSHYLRIRKQLISAGGVFTSMGFDFAAGNATEIVKAISNGMSTKEIKQQLNPNYL
ncbi:hypothetical protein OH460_07840 [Vibrio sp. Makdt]|uniref:hypothetical protein n=1 Tax=Vibrio sp. Makdt TaxID=2998828 RepID=UPI0022CD54AA|nr:hypothetical protein [Vibrio sp. Makdt]MDA0152208.1 hypothetical protein [Vibrio sp. Makdt]